MLASNIKTSGIIETNQIRIIGTTAANSVKIANVDGTEVANFANEFKCRMNGDTTILCSLYCSAPIDAYRFTATEIKARDTSGITINNSNGTTNIRLNDSGSMTKTGNIDVVGDLAITGNLSLSGSLSGYSPFWVAEEID